MENKVNFRGVFGGLVLKEGGGVSFWAGFCMVMKGRGSVFTVEDQF